MVNVYIETYGCSANQSASEKLAGLLSRSGCLLTDVANSDIIIINTCIVKKATEQKILYRINSLKKDYPDKKIIVAGCMPEVPEIIKNCKYDALVGTHNINKIATAVKNVMENKRIELTGAGKQRFISPKIRANPARDIIEIGKGCLGSCSYCIVKKAKGDLFSYSPEEIIKEVENAVKSGCREIWLTSQDCGCYGFDRKTNIAELINRISEIKGRFFVRVGMMNPNNIKKILPELLEAYKSEKVYKFLHMPVQSGSDAVLEKMNRFYTVSEFEEIIRAFRSEFPKMQIWTDVIAGFPGETENDFALTLKLLEKVKPDFANISQFGIRPGTPAEKMKQVDNEIKKNRTRELTELVNKLSLEANKKWVGWKGDVLISERSKTWIGRNFAYKPVAIYSKEKMLGKVVKVKITNYSHSALIGEVL